MTNVNNILSSEIRRPTTNVNIIAFRQESHSSRPDVLATEEPMEIRLHGPNQKPVSISVTMRTPGNDFELAVGFLYSEGLLSSMEQLRTVCYCEDVAASEQLYNIVTVELNSTFIGNQRERSFNASSACGLCGTTTIDEIKLRTKPVESSISVKNELLLQLPQKLRLHQKIFNMTGGLHGAGIFNLDGELELIREDIGRHNALDKVIGHYFLNSQQFLAEKILVLSGRIGFELVQKAAVAGISIIVAVSAPSSLAVQSAHELGITLVGFTRGDKANIYTHAQRVELK